MELEKIFLKEGKFVNIDGNEVEAKPVGNSRLVRMDVPSNEKFIEGIHDTLKSRYVEANAFSEGMNAEIIIDRITKVYIYSFQLYKI